MNMDNNNFENNLGSDSLGNVQAPINNEPMNSQGEDTFSPFQDLSNEPLNVPTENLDVQPTINEVAPQADVPVSEPNFYQPTAADANVSSVGSMDVNPSPSIESINPEPSVDTFNTQPTVNNTFEPAQSTPVVDTFSSSPVSQEPVGLSNDAVNQSAPVMENQAPAATVIPEPTMPIPDQMPTTDYQAGVSTPVDYATPMSDFDQIGTTPELDAKAKGTKKNNKLLLLVLLIVIIGGLGYGAYYLINVKGILESNGVTLKEITAEKGEALSVNIDDYATFKNTSSSNCSLDTTKVDVTKQGTYEFTISCGKKTYKGKLTVKDTKGPQVEFKTNIIAAGTPLTAEMFVDNANENATYAYASETETEVFSTSGLKTVKIIATDEIGNAKTYVVPVIVTSNEYSMGLVAKKTVDADNTEATVTEKNAIIYNNSAGIINDTSYTAYIVKFNSKDAYNTIASTVTEGQLTYGSYTGIPVLYPSSNIIVLVKDINTDLIKDEFNTTFTNLKTNNYETSIVNQSTNKDLINFDK